MKPAAHRRTIPFAALLITLWACGDDGHGNGGPAPIPTLAYVLSECSERPPDQGFVFQQRLLLRQGDGDPVTVAEFPAYGLNWTGPCRIWGQRGNGLDSMIYGAFQRLAMSPDGSVLVFEVTDDFSPAPSDLPPDQEGIFVLRTDGSGLRRIAAASRNECFRYDFDTNTAEHEPFFAFNADSSRITYTDLGPGPDGDAPQIFTMDLATGTRRQVTHLPPAPNAPPGRIPTGYPGFVGRSAIAFHSYANPVIDGEESNPEGQRRVFTVKPPDPNDPEEPEGLRVIPFAAEPGGSLLEAFQITGPEPAARGIPMEPPPPSGCCEVWEAFVLDEKRVLQLTHFGSSNTKGTVMSADRQRVIFQSDADPFGTNPCNNNQLFSIDRTGGDLRQLTHFNAGGPSQPGCDGGSPPSKCFIYIDVHFAQDPVTGWILFFSNCDPLGSNSSGTQIFAVRPDGTGLRQLTHTRGMVRAPDGTVTVELPGPWASPGRRW